MDFKRFFFDMTPTEREVFAASAGSTPGTLTQVAYGHKSIELGFADVLCALSKRKVDMDSLPLTERAQRQRSIREAHATKRTAKAA